MCCSLYEWESLNLSDDQRYFFGVNFCINNNTVNDNKYETFFCWFFDKIKQSKKKNNETIQIALLVYTNIHFIVICLCIIDHTIENSCNACDFLKIWMNIDDELQNKLNSMQVANVTSSKCFMYLHFSLKTMKMSLQNAVLFCFIPK